MAGRISLESEAVQFSALSQDSILWWWDSDGKDMKDYKRVVARREKYYFSSVFIYIVLEKKKKKGFSVLSLPKTFTLQSIVAIYISF